MKLDQILELLSFTLPAIVTGAVAYYFFLTHTKSEEVKMKLSMVKANRKQALPVRLQAYERMTLFLERMNPSNLLLRITSINDDKKAYATSLINTIEQEFEHNISQQIYISEKCWSVIVASKNATVHIIKKSSDNETIRTAQQLREEILKMVLNSSSPSTAALSFIKEEVRDFI
ncbi:hypothetical protein [Lutibacter sp.]|uniref:DUF7935 family protein n=1 Tax=Lutibacter sp. TaxID=1925666 RepID=UPI001A21B453|nr:hypothetical protein [Lutibacter sp.]MBI9042578.1 hypothetical protein [Lutibacter sp.]